MENNNEGFEFEIDEETENRLKELWKEAVFAKRMDNIRNGKKQQKELVYEYERNR